MAEGTYNQFCPIAMASEDSLHTLDAIARP